jgi:hypothetical protein
MFSISLVGSRETSLKRIFSHFQEGPSSMEHVSIGVRMGRETLYPLRHVAVLIPLSLLIMLPVVSSAVFLSVRPSLIAIRFGSSSQLLSRSFSFRHNGEEGGRWKEGEGGRGREGEAGKHALLIKLQA